MSGSSKLSQKRLQELKADYRSHNKRMIQSNNRWRCFESLEQYIQYRYGTTKASKVKHRVKPTAAKSPVSSQSYRRSTVTDTLPSSMNRTSLAHSGSKGATSKHPTNAYTGDYIIGLATTHKSNIVPVSRGIDPKDYSTMRRN